ncbi:MAG: hypothetical protein QME42_08385 [bacterium]|nr:hypothetical protein [bacterium]
MAVQNKRNIYIKHDVKVMDSFIDKFARKYIEQRSQTNTDISSLSNSQMFKTSGFDTSLLEEIIGKNSVAHDFRREERKTPSVLQDIYRSDLGELLMTYYFEEKIDENFRYIIPLKNITYRERDDMPGRGIDAIGYKINDNKIDILLSEDKVSAEKKNPPAVVDKTNDSIYATQKKYNDNLDIVVRRLSDYCRRLDAKNAEVIGLAILNIDSKKTEVYSITLGCTLIRDFTCVDSEKDFGKMKLNSEEFNPNKIHFSIMSFTEKKIEQTVQLFYEKVQELIK